MAKKNPTLSSLRQGQTVFYAHALSENSFVTEYKLSGRPFKRHGDWFVNRGNREFDWLSLDDCNVIPNRYNSHRLFYKRGKAEKYVRECIEMEKGLSHGDDDDDNWDIMDCIDWD